MRAHAWWSPSLIFWSLYPLITSLYPISLQVHQYATCHKYYYGHSELWDERVCWQPLEIQQEALKQRHLASNPESMIYRSPFCRCHCVRVECFSVTPAPFSVCALSYVGADLLWAWCSVIFKKHSCFLLTARYTFGNSFFTHKNLDYWPIPL